MGGGIPKENEMVAVHWEDISSCVICESSVMDGGIKLHRDGSYFTYPERLMKYILSSTDLTQGRATAVVYDAIQRGVLEEFTYRGQKAIRICRRLKAQTLSCTKCGWRGGEDDLKRIPSSGGPGEWVGVCPICMKNEHLKNTEVAADEL